MLARGGKVVAASWLMLTRGVSSVQHSSAEWWGVSGLVRKCFIPSTTNCQESREMAIQQAGIHTLVLQGCSGTSVQSIWLPVFTNQTFTLYTGGRGFDPAVVGFDQ